MHMFYDDHAPPRFHARHAEDEALLKIADLAILNGGLPARALGLVVEWASAHQQELLDNYWKRAQNGEPIAKIPPLE